MFYLPNTPLWLRLIFPAGVVWNGDPANNSVYLSFDDGPDPEPTQFVLDQLEQYNFKATFFCIGDNVARHPKMFEKIRAAGHRIGNHTMHHPNGWTTNNAAYVGEIMEAHEFIQSNLFRPPYGKITAAQARSLGKKELAISNGTAGGIIGAQKHEKQLTKFTDHRSQITDHRFKIIMWSVIAGDFDEKIDGIVCYNHIVKYTRAGSIIVFHDSQKAFQRLKIALPKTLAWIREKGFNPKLL